MGTMSELLLEVGCEELPASFVRKAYTDLLASVSQQLAEAGVLEEPGTAMGTPRRLILSFPKLKARQEDQVKEVRGPGVKAAYDADGNPTQALLGFCRGQGVDPADLRKDDQYVWASKTVVGRPTTEILSEVLPKAIRGLSFDKTMRWGSSRMRFARPIRWIVATFGGSLVPFGIEGVLSGIHSYGHRFYAPEPFPATNLQMLLTGLRDRNVEPDAEVRREKILSQATAVAEGRPDFNEGLLEENAFLTEWPTAIQGEFKEGFLDLPEAVLVTAMAKHERMFPVRDEIGKLTNKFVFIRNSGQDEDVRRGSEWVLNARFNDAKFFYDEDSQHNLDYFLEQTSQIIFQEKLGTVRQRADRLSKLAEHIALNTGAIGREVEFARTAGLYAKADLSTGLVSELSSLQGIIGGAYARREGIFGSIAWAIETQYDITKNTDPGDCSGERASLRLSMADQLDKLAGYLGIGKEPTGSSDPFGLRRAATILIEIAWMWPGTLPSYESFFDFALGLYADQGFELDGAAAKKSLISLFASRYSSMLPDVRHDALEAAMLSTDSPSLLVPRGVRLRKDAINAFTEDTAFIQTARRPLNILASARRDGVEFSADGAISDISAASLESAEAEALLAAAASQVSGMALAVVDEDAQTIIKLVKQLASPINTFFDTTMVMAENPAVRHARLSLLAGVAQQLLAAGDFSKLVIEG